MLILRIKKNDDVAGISAEPKWKNVHHHFRRLTEQTEKR